MITKTLNEIWFLMTILYETCIIILSIITAKDPCKNCIVKACCTSKCEERIYLENFILKGETLFSQKFLAWFTVIFTLAITTWIIHLIANRDIF